MPKASTTLQERYNEACKELHTFFSTVEERVKSGGDAMSAAEREKVEGMATTVDTRKEDYEAQRDLEKMVSENEPISVVERDVSSVGTHSEEAADSFRKVARDATGADGLREYDENVGAVLADFAHISGTGDKTRKIKLNPERARNFAMLRSMGVSTMDYVNALRSGRHMIATRDDDGNPDVRAYNITTSGEGMELVPTFWDNSLYLFASYIGGVQAAGAMILPVLGNNALKLPKVTGYASGLGIATEATALTTGTQDTTDTTDLMPRPYRGFAAETDELMRSAAIDVRMLLVLRGLSRALQLGKENAFHNGTGVGQPKGILHGVTDARITKTGGVDVNIRYQDLPAALALLDAEYHQPGREGSLSSLMHSAIWFTAFVGAVSAQDGHPIYPHLARGGKDIFSTQAVFSHAMAKVVAANNLLACTGNFMDAYVIATMGSAEIEVSDDVRFLSWERVYRIQEYCDGQVQDTDALAYVQSKA